MPYSLPGRAALIEVHRHGLGRGRPHPEGGLLLRPHGAQIVAVIGVGLLKLLGRKYVRHGDRILRPVEYQLVGLAVLQRLLQRQDIFPVAGLLRRRHGDGRPVRGAHLERLRRLAVHGARGRHGDRGGLAVIRRPGHQHAGGHIVPVLPGVALHAGLHIDMHRAGRHVRQLDELVGVYVLLRPVAAALADDEAHLGSARRHRDGGHHLAVLLGEGIAGALLPVGPGPHVPVVIVAVRAVVVQLDHHAAAGGSGGHHAAERGRDQQDQREDRAGSPPGPASFVSCHDLSVLSSKVMVLRGPLPAAALADKGAVAANGHSPSFA